MPINIIQTSLLGVPNKPCPMKPETMIGSGDWKYWCIHCIKHDVVWVNCDILTEPAIKIIIPKKTKFREENEINLQK